MLCKLIFDFSTIVNFIFEMWKTLWKLLKLLKCMKKFGVENFVEMVYNFLL